MACRLLQSWCPQHRCGGSHALSNLLRFGARNPARVAKVRSGQVVTQLLRAVAMRLLGFVLRCSGYGSVWKAGVGRPIDGRPRFNKQLFTERPNQIPESLAKRHLRRHRWLRFLARFGRGLRTGPKLSASCRHQGACLPNPGAARRVRTSSSRFLIRTGGRIPPACLPIRPPPESLLKSAYCEPFLPAIVFDFDPKIKENFKSKAMQNQEVI
jgi:hypothetical protein